MYHITSLIQPLRPGNQRAKQSHSPVSFGSLPCELILEIADHLDLGSLNSLSQTCRELNSLLDPEITKQAQQSALAPRSHYAANFVYNNDQQHGVDFPSFRVRWGPSLDDTVAYYQRSIPPAYVPTEF
jgi:hypothetical protein